MTRAGSVSGALLIASCAVAVAGCPTTMPVDSGFDARLDAPDGGARDVPLDALLEGGGPDAPDGSLATDGAATDGAELDAGLDALMDASGLDVPSVDAPGFDVPSDAPILRMADPVTNPAAPPIPPFSTCTVTTSADTISGAPHFPACTPFTYPFLPPSAGPHYSIWANFGTYTAPVPWGFLVHAMEHGAVVLAHNCATPSDCDAVRTEFQAIIDARGVDPLCRMELWPNRIIVVPDPTLPVPIAAVAWRHVYTATCLDPTSLRAFVDAHYDTAPESFCVGGTDLSATGWCP